MSPDMLVRHYEWAGFDVLAITDHWVRTVERSTRKLLVIPSTELNATCGGESEDAHVLALGVQADPVAPGDGFAPLPEVVAWIVENGGVPYLAPTGAACARSSGRHAADSAGSRSGTRAASSRSAAATRRSTGTRRSSAARRSTRSRPTTRTIRATTAAWRGRWCGPPRDRRTPCSKRSVPAASTAPRVLRSTM